MTITMKRTMMKINGSAMACVTSLRAARAINSVLTYMKVWKAGSARRLTSAISIFVKCAFDGSSIARRTE